MAGVRYVEGAGEMMNRLKEAWRKGYINCRTHPTAKLSIWNYTNRCQYDRAWDETTLSARLDPRSGWERGSASSSTWASVMMIPSHLASSGCLTRSW